jgi:AcrR family transcriptional regulator
MGRWEPNARERLVLAAVELFGEQGYDSTAVAQIAERAGLTKATFFRHFKDKREVLFAGQDRHGRMLADGAAAAPDTASPLAAVAAALDALTASFTPAQREFGPALQAVIAANGELRERAAFKRASLVEALAEALRRRGVPDPAAALAADLGVHAFHQAFEAWIDPAATRTLTDLAREALDELHAAVTTLR